VTLHRGKIASKPEIVEVRALTRDDLGLLADARPGSTPTVAKLRDTHHRLARMVASGLRMSEIVTQSGYSHARLTTLNRDPAFIELVAQYRSRIDDAWAREQDAYAELMTANMLKAERMIADKLEDAEADDSPLPTRELIAISRDAADRMGYGKRQTNLNVNVDFAAKLEAARERSRRAPRMIEGTAVPLAPGLSTQQPTGGASPAASPSVEAPRTTLRRL